MPLQNKEELFADLIDESRPDLVAITETWLTPSHGDDTINRLRPDGYAAIHRPRTGFKRGGGVALFHRCSVVCKRLQESSFQSFEYLDLLLCMSPRPVRVIVIYRPPNKSCLTFLDEFSDLLDSIVVSSACLLIVGDFNFHVDSTTDSSAANFLHLIASYGLCQYVSSPTHRHGHTLDLVIGRPTDKLVGDTETGNYFSDHMTVFCYLRSRSLPPPVRNVSFRSYKSFSLDSFHTDLARLPLPTDPYNLARCFDK